MQFSEVTIGLLVMELSPPQTSNFSLTYFLTSLFSRVYENIFYQFFPTCMLPTHETDFMYIYHIGLKTKGRGLEAKSKLPYS